MIVRAVLLLLGFASLATADSCVCSQNYTRNYPTFVIQSAFDTDNYDDCSPASGQCTVVINQNDPQKGVGEFVVTEFAGGNGSLFTVVIKDGDDTAFSFTRNTYTNYIKALAGFKSRNPIVTVLLQYNKDTNVVFNMNGYPTGLAPPPSETTTVTQPPTGGPAGFLGVDLAFAFDSTGPDPAVFTTMKNVIKDAVSQLTVTEDVAQPYGARLSLQSVSSANQANNLAVPWAVTREEFLGLVNAVPTRNQKSFYQYPLNAFLNDVGYFSAQAKDGASSRTNVQRIYAIFTQHDPDDKPEDLQPVLAKLVARDVHLVVHWFGSTPSLFFPKVALPGSNIAYLPYTVNSTDFYDKYVLNGDTDQNFGCALGKQANLDIANGPGTWPPNYMRGQNNYCNNQDVTLQLTNPPDGTTALCITVKNYQLEIEKDYARFYDAAGVEVASLTGNNVFGAQFQINGTTGSVRLTTNEYLVYNGLSFTVTTKTGDNPICDPNP